ncbi:MAG: thioesterase family protein [Desulfobacterales bacterium]|nr:thioesterase family protein [Desulfobacterales bacterium]
MHLFDTDISVSANPQDGFQAAVSDNWSINGNPNGGYLLAVLASAMTRCSDKSATPILTVNYMSKTVPGPAEIAVETMNRSRQFTRLQARIIQSGTETARAFGTFAVAPEECQIRRYETGPPEPAPPERCIRIPAMPKYTVYDQLEVRLDPSCAGWMENRLSERSEHKGWLRFNDRRCFDVFAVALAADAFPPAVLASQGMVAWVPTLELSVSIRNIAETQWLKCRFTTRFINCGLLEEDGEIWDESNELIAVSRQIAQFRNFSA